MWFAFAGAKFADENFIMKHDKAGVLSMVRPFLIVSTSRITVHPAVSGGKNLDAEGPMAVCRQTQAKTQMVCTPGFQLEGTS